MKKEQTKKKQLGWTNHILIERSYEKLIYYVPCYLRLKLKNIQSIDLAAMNATFNADLLLAVYYGQLPHYVVEQLKNNIVLQFNRSESIQLTKSFQIISVDNKKQKILNFTVRKTYAAKIEGNLVLSPFQTIRLILIVTLRSMIIQNQNGKQQQIVRFNLMSTKNDWIAISYTKQKSFQNYCFSSFLTSAKFTNTVQEQPIFQEIIESEQIQIKQIKNNQTQSQQNNIQCNHQKIKYFQYAHFYIGMYRYPFMSLATIFFPMWSMATYNLFMYFQGNILSYRIANSQMTNLAMLAFIPTIRTHLPDTPKILLIEVLLYLIASTFNLTIIQSYIVSNQDSMTYQFVWQNDTWFLICLIFSLVTVLIVLILSIFHKFKWQRQYKLKQQQQNKLQRFNRMAWKNSKCDKYFNKFKCIKLL